MTYKIIAGKKAIQGSPEWLEWRRYKVGASDCATIVGWNPHKSARKLWHQIIDNEPVIVNEHMERGRRLEPFVRNEINTKIGNLYQPVCMESLRYPWLIASLDGWQDDNPLPIIEIKCPKRTLHESIVKTKQVRSEERRVGKECRL